MQNSNTKKSEVPSGEEVGSKPRGYLGEICVFCFVSVMLARANFIVIGGFYGGDGFPFFYQTFTDFGPPLEETKRSMIPVNILLCLAIAVGVTIWFRRRAISLGMVLKYFAYFLGVMFLLMYWSFYVSWPRWLFSPGETFWNFNWAIVLYRGGEVVFWPALVLDGLCKAFKKWRNGK